MITSLISLTVAAGYGLLIASLLRQQAKRGPMEWSLLSFLSLAAGLYVVSAFLALAPESPILQHAATYLWAVSLISLYYLTLRYIRWPWRPLLTVGAAAWLGGLIGLDVLIDDAVLSQSILNDLLRFPRPDPAGGVFALTWLLSAISLVLVTLYASTRANLPLHANRLLYWAGTLALVFVGQSLVAIDSTTLTAISAILQLLGGWGLLFGVTSYRLFDVRGSMRRVLAYLVSGALASAFIMTAVVVIRLLLAQASSAATLPTILGITVLAATGFVWAYELTSRFTARVIIQQDYDPAVIVETFALAIGNILDIPTLSTVAIGTIAEYFEIRRGCLVVLSEEGEVISLHPIHGMGRIPTTAMGFDKQSPIWEYFRGKRTPLLQYNIDLEPDFGSLSEDQRQWLARLQMDVYVPVMTEGLPIGLIAIGPKTSGEPFRTDELQLLQTLAGQAVVALTNARLFNDMRKLNEEIQLLNEDLQVSNERLQQMDQVKADFIVIASHELRTPLTQIKGYADILDAMAQDGPLQPGQARDMLGNISQATDQLEEVITAMLDVSQLDVDAMALDLEETKLEVVLRIAIEPLVRAMRERRLTLTIHGVRSVPPITADFQRLVQAVSNLAYNAVKYTPDGGRITISARVLKDESGADQEIELMVADTGVGIDPRDQDLIFEKFFRASDPQLHSTGSTKFMGAGPGLGLSIVRGIIEAHGGRIWVESEGYDPVNYPGSQFYLVLPIHPPRRAASAVLPTPPLGAAAG